MDKLDFRKSILKASDVDTNSLDALLNMISDSVEMNTYEISVANNIATALYEKDALNDPSGMIYTSHGVLSTVEYSIQIIGYHHTKKIFPNIDSYVTTQ